MTDQQPGIRVELRPSPLLNGALAAIHLSAIAVLAWQSELLAWFAPGGALVLAGFVNGWLKYGVRRGRRFIRTLSLQGDARWTIGYGDGREEPGELLVSSLVSPWLVILSFRTDRRRRHVLLLRDNVDPVSLRRLRVRLRYSAGRA